MATEDLSFLNDQVRRLNAALSVYQEKYPPLSDEEQSELNKRSNYLPQLLTDQSILTPLILEYDSENRALRQQVNTYRVETEGLRTKVEKLAKENERLQTELKVTVEGQLEAMGWSGEINSSNDHLTSQLQKQVSSLQEEKEAALDLWRTSSQQYEDINTKFREIRLTEQAEKLSQQALEDKAEQLLRKNGELMTTKQKLERANQHLQEIYNTHSKELTDTREQLKITRTDKRTAEVKLAEMDHGKSLLEEKLYMKIKEADTFKRDSESTRSELKEVSLSFITLQEETGQLSSENEALREAKVELEQKVKSLHWKCAEADRREFEAVNQVRESIQMVENSLLEKDEALIREKQKVVEIERMQQVMENLLNEAGKRTRQEVDTVRKQCNMNIAKLMDEIQALENETGQKQAEIERLLREKRAVEEELENLYREGSAEMSDQRVGQMQDRLISAERQKEEALMKMERLEKEIERKELSHNDKQTQLSTKYQEMRQRTERATKEAEGLAEEKLRLIQEVDRLKKNQTAVQKERDSSERKFNKELSAVQQEIMLLKAEYEAKVDSVEESSRQSSRELRQMLATHQKISAKFKEECKSLTAKYESKLAETSSQLARLKKRNDDLSLQLSQSREVVLQAEQRLSQQLSVNRKLSQSAAEHEHRADELFMKLAEQGATEKRLLQEKKYFEREMNRVRQDKTYPRRSNTSSARNSLNEGSRRDQRAGGINGRQRDMSDFRSSSLDSEHSSADI